MNLFYNKPKKVINAVRDYYNGDTTKFPYNIEEVQLTKAWLKKYPMNGSSFLKERLNMIETLMLRKALN